MYIKACKINLLPSQLGGHLLHLYIFNSCFVLSVGSNDQAEGASSSRSRTPPTNNSNMGHSDEHHSLTDSGGV